MPTYRSKPQEVEAVQWIGTNIIEVWSFGRFVDGPNGDESTVVDNGPEGLMLLAGKGGAQGWVPVPVGHWIVRSPGDYTDHWPVDPDYFAAKYERSPVKPGA